jgi:hypothetical protein
VKQRQTDQLHALLGLDTIFPAAVDANIAVAPSHGGDSGSVNRLHKPIIDRLVEVHSKEAQMFPDGTGEFLP